MKQTIVMLVCDGCGRSNYEDGARMVQTATADNRHLHMCDRCHERGLHICVRCHDVHAPDQHSKTETVRCS